MSRRIVLLTMFIMCIIFPLFLGLTLSSPSYAQDPTPTHSPLPPLTDPKPSYHELDKYVSTLIGRDAFLESGLQEGDAIISFIDLNGDHLDDLVIHNGALYVVIMLWDGQKYGSPLAISQRSMAFNESSTIQLDDWTGDGILDVVYDERIRATSGTGILEFVWRRRIITCQGLSCHVAWESDYGSIETIYNYGGMSLSSSHIEHSVAGAMPCIITETWGFDVDVNPFQPFRVMRHPVIRREYVWDGYEFALSFEQHIEDGYGFDTVGKTLARNRNSVVARIAIEPSHFYAKDSHCGLWIDATAVETLARCKSNFVNVEWRDVTGDGADEAVFLLTASDREAVSDYLDYDCVHQRLLAFQILDDKYARIADIDGCVSQSDLFGVRIEDVDGDGTLEIRSAGDWFDFAVPDDPMRYVYWFDFNTQDIVYRFNGTQFIQAETIPRNYPNQVE